MEYKQFLETKIEVAKETGFEVLPEDIHPSLKPHQRDAVVWALKGGRRALFESFGLGKTIQQLEFCRQVLMRYGGKGLIVCPLGVRQEFTRDAISLLNINAPEYITDQEQADNSINSLFITNYERVRDGNIDPAKFQVVCLDEASVLRSFGSKTYQTFLLM